MKYGAHHDYGTLHCILDCATPVVQLLNPSCTMAFPTTPIAKIPDTSTHTTTTPAITPTPIIPISAASTITRSTSSPMSMSVTKLTTPVVPTTTIAPNGNKVTVLFIFDGTTALDPLKTPDTYFAFKNFTSYGFMNEAGRIKNYELITFTPTSKSCIIY